ncbi:nucleoside phosphorylase [Halobacterium wangiae]|uniref:nucleoside phosphorylase n=1 Tax=Halobacterium wangiae TaxID=2902623 RepID=UPI001E296852|nr:nucleoside phosphorylase [Halobacterium wangiae]
MPFPNLPGKYDADPVATPDHNNEYRDERADGDAVEPPEGVVVCYSRSLMEYFVESYDGELVEQYYGDLYVLNDTDGRVGVLGEFGIGAPTTAILMDELVADGVETFLSIGYTGCLDRSVEMGEFVVCDSAVRDEGTSHHYVESAKYAHATEAVVDATTDLLDERDEPYHVGPSWTTDALYRETDLEVETYAAEGVLTVEMEASAVFAVADHRGVDAGAMFVVSDYLGTDDWEPKFHLTAEDMQHLGDTAVDVLARYVD